LFFLEEDGKNRYPSMSVQKAMLLLFANKGGTANMLLSSFETEGLFLLER
jgi:hypothetical protein